MNPPVISRRAFLAVSAAIPSALAAQVSPSASAPAAPAGTPASPTVKNYPIGLELYSVRAQLGNGNDQLNAATLTAVFKMGYKLVEFWAPYFTSWTYAQAKAGRQLLDDLGIACRSTHNNANYFSDENLPKAIELNQILGTKYLVMASAGSATAVDAWKRVGDNLTAAADKLRPHGLYTGYHNHQTEWAKLAGSDLRAMDVLAANTPPDVMLQLDVGTCVMAGADPVAWIKANPGRINSVHCKEWSKAQGFNALFGEGDSPWKEIFAAAENGGGVEYYLIEQEQSPRGQELATVEKDLAAWKKLHGAA